MTLAELKQAVDMAVEEAVEFGQSAETVVVSLQIDVVNSEGDCTSCVCATDVDLTYDGDGTASGCVLLGISK